MNYKKIIKSGLMSLALLMAVGCDVDSSATNPNPAFAQLDDDRSVSILENSGQVVEILVLLGGPQGTDTQIELDVTGDSARYVLSATSISIPAGETSGTVTLSAVDDDEINGDVAIVVTLSSNSDVPVGLAGQGLRAVSKTITIVDDNVPCNDYTITVTTDNWGSETFWYLIDADGVRVAEGGPYSDGGFGNVFEVDITLADGCYTFTMWDAYGDGQVSSAGDGSYLVSCGSIVGASGSGVFDTVGFPGATGADLPNGFQFFQAPTEDLVGFVETTDFCVNQ